MKPAYQFIVQTLMVWLRALQDRLGVAPTPEIIPREMFHPFEVYSNPQLSPDGKYLSYYKLNEAAGAYNLWLIETEDIWSTKSMRNAKKLSAGGDFAMEAPILWLQDSRRLVMPKVDQTTFIFIDKLVVINVETDSQNTIDLGGFALPLKPSSRLRSKELALELVRLEDLSVGKVTPYLYTVNVDSGEKTLVLENDRFKSILFDQNFQPKLGITQDGLFIEAYKKASNGSWVLMWRTGTPEAVTFGGAEVLPHHFDHNGNYYQKNIQDFNLGTLVKTNFDTNKTDVLFSPRKGDVKDIIYDPRKETPAWVTTEYDKQEIHLLDQTLNRDINNLREIHPGNIHLLHSSQDFDQWVVKFDNDANIGAYYLYSRTKKQAQLLFSDNDQMSQYTLNKMYPMEVTARDGLKIMCYYTLPVGLDPKKNGKPVQPVPTLVYVHGGPFFQGIKWGFNPVHQQLANRGFLVFECNYRGASGYGKGFIYASEKQIGPGQSEDVMDGLKQLVKMEVADPSKMALMGESFGGYDSAYLMTRYPDLFKCAIDLFGGADYLQQLREVRKNLKSPGSEFIVPFVTRAFWDEQNPAEAALIRDSSPIHFLQNLTNPVHPLLVAHGGVDQSAWINKTEKLAQDAKKLGIPVTFMYFPDEGHGWRKPPNNWAASALYEHFLNRCLKAGKVEALDPEFPLSSIEIREAGILKELEPLEKDWAYIPPID